MARKEKVTKDEKKKRGVRGVVDRVTDKILHRRIERKMWEKV